MVFFISRSLSDDDQLNTLAHALFALVIYVQWWSKPLDIKSPTIIRGDAARSMLAWMSMYQPMSKLGIRDRDHRREAQLIRTVNRHDAFAQSVSKSRLGYQRHGQVARDTVLQMQQRSKGSITLADCDELLSTGLCFYDSGPTRYPMPEWYITLKPMDVERWKCAAVMFIERPPSGIWTEYEDAVTTYISDWLPLIGRRTDIDVSLWLSLTIAAFLYGGLHALPWSTDFSTGVEKQFWRASVLSTIILGPLIPLYPLLQAAHHTVRDTRSRFLIYLSGNSWLPKWTRIIFSICYHTMALVIYVAIAAVMASYCVGRVFLVVESLIALFQSTPDIYKMPAWSIYFPHIT